MNDLINRQAVETAIKRYFHGLIDKHIFDIDVVDCAKEVSEAIDSVPIAYDVDKVVERLEKWKRQSDDGLIAVGVAIEIVKGAVKDVHSSNRKLY